MTSDPQNIPLILKLIEEEKPESIIDFGVGFGKYGFLCREYFESTAGRIHKDQFTLTIDGIEAYHEGIGDIQRAVYNRISAVDVRSFIPDRSYDLALWVDILEHMPRSEALKTFKRLMDFCKCHIISTPRFYFEEELAFNEEFDAHKSIITDFDIFNIVNLSRYDVEDFSNEKSYIMRIRKK